MASSRPVKVRTAALACTIMALACGRAGAQVNTVRAVADETGAALQGALVTLGVGDSEWHDSQLTDAFGVATFADLSADQRYLVRVEMIGYASVTQTDVVVERELSLTVRLTTRPIELSGLDVSAGERCSIPRDEGAALARVWDEARKALEAARFTTGQGLYRYRIEKTLRDVELRSGRVLNEEGAPSTGLYRTPYESLPADELAEGGYVQRTGSDETTYYAPDADVLLSDAFLDTHCMRLVVGEGEQEGRVGIAFRPRSDRRVTEISGTLWLDPDGWLLEQLTFAYEGLRSPITLREIGGEVDFARLPDGSWLVPAWTIRMPLLGRGTDLQGRPQVFQLGVREERGAVLDVRDSSGRPVLTAGTGSVQGVVVDSVGTSGWSGVTVRLVGAGRTTRSDSVGTFFFGGLTPGSYTLEITHPELPVTAYRPPIGDVRVEAGHVSGARISMPGTLALLRMRCAVAMPPTGRDPTPSPIPTGVFAGRVLDSSSRLPLPRAVVSVGSSVDPDVVRNVVTDEEGRYHVCIDRRERLDVVRARWGPFVSDVTPLSASSKGRDEVRDLLIPMRGVGVVIGSLVEATTGIPVPGATVRITDDEDEAWERVSETDAEGAFRLDDVPGGLHRLVIAHDAYTGGADSIRVQPGGSTHVAGRIAEIPAELRAMLPRLVSRVQGVSVEVTGRTVSLLGGRVGTEPRPAPTGASAAVLERIRGAAPDVESDPVIAIDGVIVYDPGQSGGGRGGWPPSGLLDSASIVEVRWIPPAEAAAWGASARQRGVLVVQVERGETR
jgi:hypothetical protein